MVYEHENPEKKHEQEMPQPQTNQLYGTKKRDIKSNQLSSSVR